MTLKIPMQIAHSVARIGENSAGWKLGQITQGRVTDGGRENPTVTIRGANYPVTSNLSFTQGEALVLKVSSVSPRLEFSIVSRVEPGVGKNNGIETVFSDKFLQSSALTQRNINASLTNLVNLLHMRTSAPLPPTTALLINSMRERLMRADGLADPKRLHSGLLNSSLLLSTSSGANSAGNGLPSLLNKIAASLAAQSNSVRGLPPGMKYPQTLGMSLYLSSDGNSLNGFSRSVEEQCANLMNLRERTQNFMQHDAYRLLAELPVLLRDRIESISIRFFKKNTKEGEGHTGEDETEYGADFEFEFDDGKIYTKIVICNSAVSITAGCANEDTVEHLAVSRAALEERLENYGLDLIALSVSNLDDYLSFDKESLLVTQKQAQTEETSKQMPVVSEKLTDDATRSQLRKIHTEGRLPELEEFSLSINSQDIEAVCGIPEQLYCAMACFFAQLYAVEPD